MDPLAGKVNIDTILGWCKEQVENKIPVAPSMWLDAAQKLLILLQDLDEDIVEAEMAVNRATRDFMLEDESASSAKLMVKATPEYEKLLKLQAKRERVMGIVQVAKKRTELHL